MSDKFESPFKRLVQRKSELHGNSDHWARQHTAAWDTPKDAFERALVLMLKGWIEYAEAHYRRYESTIGEDYVLGPLWAEQGKCIIGLLNGERGRLDAGTIDGLVRQIGTDNGFEGAGQW